MELLIHAKDNDQSGGLNLQVNAKGDVPEMAASLNIIIEQSPEIRAAILIAVGFWADKNNEELLASKLALLGIQSLTKR